MDNDVFGLIGGLIGVLVLASIVTGFIVFSVYVWWRIVSKTGHSGWLGLLMFVPIAGIVLLLILAFGEWPIHRELEDLKRKVAAAG